jgi:hypothetical protein
MEQAQSNVCAAIHDTGILIHKRLKSIEDTVTHVAMCPDCQKKFDDGYVAIVICDESKSEIPQGDLPKADPSKMWRTGEIMHVKEEVFKKIFNMDPPDAKMVFGNEEVREYLVSIMHPDNAPPPEEETTTDEEE